MNKISLQEMVLPCNGVRLYFYRYILAIILIPFTILAKDGCLLGEGRDEGDVVMMKYRKTTLDNGLRVIMVEHHELPVVAIEMLVKTGSVHDPQGKSGLAHIVALLLREGTRLKDSPEISEEIDFIGGSLSADCDYDASSVTATALTKHFHTILGLLSEAVRFPTFKTKYIDFHRHKAITSILREKDNKASIAGRHFSEMMYGTHPYAHPPIGTVDGLKAITENEITQFHKAYYVPENSILTVVGDIDPAKILVVIKETFGDWKKGKVPSPILPPMPELKGYNIRIVDKPDLTQTEILLGHPGIRRDDPDYFSIILMNYILGGGPASRLYNRVRAEKGLTYSVGSRFDARKLRGHFSIRTYSKNETAIEVLRLVLDELKGLKSEGITEEELDRAKSYFVGHFPLSMETPAQIAAKIIDQEFYGLPDDYLDKYPDNIRKVSMKDMNRAITRVLDPDNIVITLVGRAEDIIEEARVLGKVELKEP